MEVASENLTAKQEKALAALLALGEVKAAAKSSGVGETTLWRWLKDDAFNAAYRDGRRRLVEASASRLTADSSKASRVLLEAVWEAQAALRRRSIKRVMAM
jgi:predicted site-specific integrase-resolvase